MRGVSKISTSDNRFRQRGCTFVSLAARTAAVVCPAVAVLSASNVWATAITANSYVTIPDSSADPVGVGGVIGSNAYYFVGGANGGTPTNTDSTDIGGLSYVASATMGTGNYYSSGYSTLMLSTGVSTSAYETSVLYSGVTSETVATITLSSTVAIPQVFQIGILNDNSSTQRNSTSFTLNEYNTLGTEVASTPLFTDPAKQIDVNNFYLADISGASPGDKIAVVGTGTSGTYVTFGGVVFDSVPEPASLSLLGIGIPALLLRRRRGGPRCHE